MAGPHSAAVGTITRGTTHPNRLRRVDRWLVGPAAGPLRRACGPSPVVVDLGFGAAAVTTLELSERLRRVRPDVEVVGIEIDPERVRAAAVPARPGVTFVQGGFELPVPGGRCPVVVRAFNVLRQYPEADVGPAWQRVLSGMAPGGLFVDGTCDEIGRRACWVALTPENGPVSLTLSVRLAGLGRPSDVAERLPKVVIHRNTPGEPVHAFLAALDGAWLRAAGRGVFGVRQRWLATVAAVRDAGWPVLDRPQRWRLGEVTVSWDAVRPRPLP